MEDKKKLYMIITIVTVLLCGCPGLCGLVYGGMTAAGADFIDYSGNISPGVFGGGMICVGIIFILIPIVAGVLYLRQRNKEAVVEDVDVPPAL